MKIPYRFNETVISIHAHPDDAEAYCSGTLKLLKNKGYKIIIATMTGGGMGGINMTEEETVKVRQEEAANAASVLDAEYYSFNQRDAYVLDKEELRINVTSLIRKVKAGIVMTHLHMDYHSDHRTTCNIVETATIVASLPNVPYDEDPLEITPLLYHTAPLTLSDPIGTEIAPPHFFVDITTTIDTKIKMLSFHKSQMDLMRVMHKVDNFFDHMKSHSADLGKMAGVEYGEVFCQHLGGGFQKENQIQEDLSEFVKYI